MRNTFSIKKVLILVTILAVPGFLYYLLTEKGKNRYRPLEIFGPKQVASTFHTKRGVKIPDTIYHRVENFAMENQSGQLVKFPSDSARINIFNLFKSDCNGPCNNSTKALQRLVNEYKKNRMVYFNSITANPQRDDPSRLKHFSDSLGVDARKWNFLTGDPDVIYHVAKNGFLIDVYKDPTSGTIAMNPLLVLIDPQMRIRGYYDPGSKEQVDKLSDEIKVLIAEELRQVTDR